MLAMAQKKASRLNLPDPHAGHLRFAVVDLLRLGDDTGRALADVVDSLAMPVGEVDRNYTAARVVARIAACHLGLDQRRKASKEDRLD